MSWCLVGSAASLLEEKNDMKKMRSVAVSPGSTLSPYSRFSMRFVHLVELFLFSNKMINLPLFLLCWNIML